MDTGNKGTAPEIDARWVFTPINCEFQLAATSARHLSGTQKHVGFYEFPAIEYPNTGSTE